jgi:hypothetical protein
MANKSMIGTSVSAQIEASGQAAERVVGAHAEFFHYTGESGLRGIFESNALRATLFSDMNDAHEIHELRTSFKNEMVLRLTPVVLQMRRQKPPEHVVWAEGIIQRLADRWCSTLYDVMFNDDEETRTAFCCTTSFCSHANDQRYEREHGLLSQWRGYGGDGGFCLVFDSSALLKLFEQERSNFMYVYTDLREAYYPRDGARALESFTDLLDESEAVIRAALDDSRNFTVDAISLPFLASATAFKHEGFHEEREVRLVAMAGTQLAADRMKGVKGFDPTPVKKILKDTRGGRDRRYILLFGKDFPPLPLRRVIVGPAHKQEENAVIARKIVGDEIPVLKSATPYIG